MLFPCLKMWFAVFHGQLHTSYQDWSPLSSFFFSLSGHFPDTFPTIRKVRCALWIILPASGLKLESFFQVQLQNQLSRLWGRPSGSEALPPVGPHAAEPQVCCSSTQLPSSKREGLLQGRAPALHTPLCTHPDKSTLVFRETYMDRCFQVRNAAEFPTQNLRNNELFSPSLAFLLKKFFLFYIGA